MRKILRMESLVGLALSIALIGPALLPATALACNGKTSAATSAVPMDGLYQTSAAATSGTVSFTVSSTGRATATCLLDEVPDTTCSVTLYSQTYRNNIPAKGRRLITARNVTSKKKIFRASNLPPIKQIDGNDSIVFFACKWVCDGTIILSDTSEGSYANCGTGTDAVSANKWVSLFQIDAR